MQGQACGGSRGAGTLIALGWLVVPRLPPTLGVGGCEAGVPYATGTGDPACEPVSGVELFAAGGRIALPTGVTAGDCMDKTKANLKTAEKNLLQRSGQIGPEQRR